MAREGMDTQGAEGEIIWLVEKVNSVASNFMMVFAAKGTFC